MRGWRPQGVEAAFFRGRSCVSDAVPATLESANPPAVCQSPGIESGGGGRSSVLWSRLGVLCNMLWIRGPTAPA